MYLLTQAIYCCFPLIALYFLITGIKKNTIYPIISSLWLSLIALIIHYQASGGQILGSYFNYLNATTYSLNLIILSLSLIAIISHLSHESLFKYSATLIQSLITIGCVLVLINLWVNAFFIEKRMPGTPVMQVALIQKPDYCSYRYMFYKVAADGTVLYLCPNHYGLIPSVGSLFVRPDFIMGHLSVRNKKHLLLLQKKKPKSGSV